MERPKEVEYGMKGLREEVKLKKKKVKLVMEIRVEGRKRKIKWEGK